MPVEVVLEESDSSRLDPNYSGVRCYFVVIHGVPHSKGLVICNALPIERALKIKEAVEQSLRAYDGTPEPPPPKIKPMRTRFERVRSR